MERTSVFFAFLRVRFAVYSRALLSIQMVTGPSFVRDTCMSGAEATRADGATESLLKSTDNLAVEGLGDLGAGADVIGVHFEFVRRLTDEVEEGCVDPIIDLIFLFVEQVFAGCPFLVGFLRLQRYGFLAWGGCLLWGAWFVLLLVPRGTCARLGVVLCRCRCVVACVSRGVGGCDEWLLTRARTIY